VDDTDVIAVLGLGADQRSDAYVRRGDHRVRDRREHPQGRGHHRRLEVDSAVSLDLEVHRDRELRGGEWARHREIGHVGVTRPGAGRGQLRRLAVGRVRDRDGHRLARYEVLGQHRGAVAVANPDHETGRRADAERGRRVEVGHEIAEDVDPGVGDSGPVLAAAVDEAELPRAHPVAVLVLRVHRVDDQCRGADPPVREGYRSCVNGAVSRGETGQVDSVRSRRLELDDDAGLASVSQYVEPLERVIDRELADGRRRTGRRLADRLRSRVALVLTASGQLLSDLVEVGDQLVERVGREHCSGRVLAERATRGVLVGADGQCTKSVDLVPAHGGGEWDGKDVDPASAQLIGQPAVPAQHRLGLDHGLPTTAALVEGDAGGPRFRAPVAALVLAPPGVFAGTVDDVELAVGEPQDRSTSRGTSELRGLGVQVGLGAVQRVDVVSVHASVPLAKRRDGSEQLVQVRLRDVDPAAPGPIVRVETGDLGFDVKPAVAGLDGLGKAVEGELGGGYAVAGGVGVLEASRLIDQEFHEHGAATGRAARQRREPAGLDG
jgi:hypothetical protein